MRMTKKMGVLLAAAYVMVSASAAAQPAPGDEARPEVDEGMGVEPGFWLRGGVGFGSSSLSITPPGGGSVDVSTDAAIAADLGIGYAPASWIAIGLIASFSQAEMSVSSGGTTTSTGLTYISPMLGARLYPFQELGLNFGVGGGWSWALLDASTLPSTYGGPAWSAAIGFDGLILGERSFSGEHIRRHRLLGASIRLDDSPSLKGSDWTGSAWSLSVLLEGTI